MQTKYLVSIYYHSTPSTVYHVFFRPCDTQSFTGKHGKRYDLDLQLHDISWVKVLQTKNCQKKNIKSWLEHRNSYGHIFSLKIEASMNPLLYKLSNFQVLQSDLVWFFKVTFSGQKNVTSIWGINMSLWRNWRSLLMWSLFSDPRLDSNQIQSCHLPVRQRHTCHHEISWLQVSPVISRFKVLYKGYSYRSVKRVNTPENHGGKGRRDNFLFGFGNLSGANCYNFRVVFHMKQINGYISIFGHIGPQKASKFTKNMSQKLEVWKFMFSQIYVDLEPSNGWCLNNPWGVA